MYFKNWKEQQSKLKSYGSQNINQSPSSILMIWPYCCPLESQFIFRSHMNFEMFCKISFIWVSLVALVALEWPLPSVLPHVPLQITRRSTSIVALVTFERLFACVLQHHVDFQMNSWNAGILTCCASVWLFTRVCPLVRHKVAWLGSLIFTLIAMMQIFPGVRLDMQFEAGRLVAWKVAQCALVRFLLGVNEGVPLQIPILNKSHCGQLYFLTPLWICLCWKRLLLLANVFGHTSQDNSAYIFRDHLLSSQGLCVNWC